MNRAGDAWLPKAHGLATPVLVSSGAEQGQGGEAAPRHTVWQCVFSRPGAGSCRPAEAQLEGGWNGDRGAELEAVSVSRGRAGG